MTETIASIRKSVARRAITRLCHFTPSRNLAHISVDPRGILASNHLDEDERTVFNPTDLNRLDGYPDHVCCSIQYPNAWYFRNARSRERLFRDWVVVLIEARYLWHAGTKFCPRNAAAEHGRLVREGPQAFESLFDDVVLGVRAYRRGPAHPAFLPTDEQAEVLIPDRIQRRDVIGIAVRDDSQARREASRLDLLGQRPPQIWVVPEAGGNGVAMRVLPHALFLAGQDNPMTLMHDVVLDGSATHGHPRALVGATVYAYAAWSLARHRDTLRFGELLETLLDEAPVWSRFPTPTRERGSWFEAADEATDTRYGRIWEQTTIEMRELLEKARTGLGAGALADDHAVLKNLGCFGRAKGAGTSSAAGAAYLAARHAAQPVQGILRAAFEKGTDTDTLAAMAGGLMGCLAGVEWLPQPWLQVQDVEYLRKIAAKVAQGPEGALEKPVEPLPLRQSILSNLALKGTQEVRLGGAMRAVAATSRDPKPLGKNVVVRAWRLETDDGQTMYVTKLGRALKESRESNRTCLEAEPRHQLHQTRRSTSDDDSSAAPGSALESKDVLYNAFCQQLHTRLTSAGELKSKEIEDGFGLVRSQAAAWLKRAEQEGFIERASKRSASFRLLPPIQ